MRTLRLHHLMTAAGLAAALLVMLNFAIARSARHLAPQQLLQRIDATAANARYVFLGDSQMEADADPVAFSAGCARPKDWRPSLNVGLGGTKAPEHCLVLEHLLERAPAADTLFYGFYDQLPTERVPSQFRDLGGNRALAFAFPKRAAQLLFPDDHLRRWGFRTIARIPMIAERLGMWAKVERVRRTLATIGLPPVQQNHFGRAADFAAIEPTSSAEFEGALARTVREQEPLNYGLREIMRIAAQHQLKFYLIVMPVPTAHRARYYSSTAWSEYRAYVADLTRAGGGQLIDGSPWVRDEDFEDPLHTAPSGARIFSTRLAQEVCPPDAAPPKQ